jgi:hypothetical protein
LGLLSVYDGSQIDPESAWRHYTEVLTYRSAGALAVSVGECIAMGVTARRDPEPFKEHAVIDFTSVEPSRIRPVSEHLADLARRRDWQYQPLP